MQQVSGQQPTVHIDDEALYFTDEELGDEELWDEAPTKKLSGMKPSAMKQPLAMQPMMMQPMMKPLMMMQPEIRQQYRPLRAHLMQSSMPHTDSYARHYGPPQGNDDYFSIGRYELDASPAERDDEKFTWSTRADAAREGELDFIGIGDEFAAPDPAVHGLDSYIYGYEHDGYHVEFGYGTEASRPPDYDDPEDERAYPNGVIYEDDPDFPSFEDDYDDGYEEGYEGGYEGYA